MLHYLRVEYTEPVPGCPNYSKSPPISEADFEAATAGREPEFKRGVNDALKERQPIEHAERALCNESQPYLKETPVVWRFDDETGHADGWRIR